MIEETGSTRVRVEFWAPNAVRITHAPLSAADFPPDRPWLQHIRLPSEPCSPEAAELEIHFTPTGIQIYTNDGKLVLGEAQPPRLDEAGTVGLALDITPGEGFYGWGEWFNGFRRETGMVQLKIRDALAWMQNKHTYSALPIFLSDRGYAFFLLNSHTSTWTLAPDRETIEIEAGGPPVDYLVIYGPSFKRILETYTALTGRPPLLPQWAFGLWVTGYPQTHQEKVINHVEEHRRRQIPLDAVILDYHWEETFHNFRWRRDIIPDPDRMIAQLKERGVHLGLITTPFQNIGNRRWYKFFLYLYVQDIPFKQLLADERALPEYELARTRGYLAHEKANWWFGTGGMIDFANPEAAAWWNNLMKPRYEQGVAFFKNDDGEYLPEDAHSALGIDGKEYHNLYGFFYGRALYEGMADLDDRRPLIYARSVWAGSQRYPGIFMGDQKPTGAHLHSTIRAGLNLSLLGFAYWTADVFGLDGKTTPEMHLRYAQWALMTPIARYFIRPPHVDNTRFPWSHGPAAETNFRSYAELRYRLLPTYYTLSWEAYRTGIPMLRPMILEFQNDLRMAPIDDQLMLGPNLMLAPVTKEGARTRPIILPKGIWHDFWTERSWEGDTTIDYPAPLDRLPMLVKGGTLLILGVPLQFIPENHRFEKLELHAWPPYNPAVLGELYEDDGVTRAYQQGAYAVTAFSITERNNTLMTRIAPATGTLPGLPAERELLLIFHRIPRPQGVRINGPIFRDWHWENDTLTLQFKAPTNAETLIEIKF